MMALWNRHADRQFGRLAFSMHEYEFESLHRCITRNQKAGKLPQHTSQRKHQSFGVADLETEFKLRIVAIWQLISRPWIRRERRSIDLDSALVCGPKRLATVSRGKSRVAPIVRMPIMYNCCVISGVKCKLRDGQFTDTCLQRLSRRQCKSNIRAREQGRAFQRRRDSQLIGVMQRREFGFQLLDQLSKAAEQFQTRADLQPQRRSSSRAATPRELRQ